MKIPRDFILLALTAADELHLSDQDAEDILRTAPDPISGAWRCWAVIRRLIHKIEDKRDDTVIRYWNSARRVLTMSIPPEESILWAELVSCESSIAVNLFQDPQHARVPLEEGARRLDELAAQFQDAARHEGRGKSALDLAGQLQRMLASFDPSSDHSSVPDEIDSSERVLLLERWVEDRLLPMRSWTTAKLVDLLISRGNFDEAYQRCQAVIHWTLEVFTDTQVEDFNKGLIRTLHSVANVDTVHHSLWQLLSMMGITKVRAADASVELTKRIENLLAAHDLHQLASGIAGSWGNGSDWRVQASKVQEAVVLGKLADLEEDRATQIKLLKEARRIFAQANQVYLNLYTTWRINPDARIERSLRKLIAELEYEGWSDVSFSMIHTAKRSGVLTAYKLLLTILAARNSNDFAAAEEYALLTEAVRLPEARVNYNARGNIEKVRGLIKLRHHPLRVLDMYLRCLPSTAVVLMQGGIRTQTFLTIEPGTGPVQERVRIAAVSEKCTSAIMALLLTCRDDREAMLAGLVSDRSPASTALLAAGEAVYNELPESVRHTIESAETVLFIPDPYGDLSTFPIELLRSQKGWLGLTHVIARYASLTMLQRALDPNGPPSILGNKGYAIRAQDPDYMPHLSYADREMDTKHVPRYLRLLGLDVTVEQVSTPNALLQALNSGYRVVHYAGHGAASSLAEGLIIRDKGLLTVKELVQLSGYKTPFVYLSACDVGRIRDVAGGLHLGFAKNLLVKSAPAVLACLGAVSDMAACLMSQAFYAAADKLPIGPALKQARADLERAGINPVWWGSYVMYGDPAFTVSPNVAVAFTRSRNACEDWATYLCRFLAGRRHEDFRSCLELLSQAIARTTGAEAEHLATVKSLLAMVRAGWRVPRRDVEELARQVQSFDPVAGSSVLLILVLQHLVLQEESLDIDWYMDLVHSTVDPLAASVATAQLGIKVVRLREFGKPVLQDVIYTMSAWAAADTAFEPLHTYLVQLLDGVKRVSG